MAAKRTRSRSEPRGAQKWILAELRSLPPAASLSTSKIAKRIAKSSGKKFHQNSVYLALRQLAGRGDIKATRVGLEKTYRVAKGHERSGDKSPPGGEAARVETSPHTDRPPQPTRSDFGVQAASLPHKLALGEILVLSIGDGHVLTATNLHGRLALERHPLPP
ncbi:MAG: hypothetical protein ACHQ2Y_02820 [Candidatus Lutacidiplasmatales archaeon]